MSLFMFECQGTNLVAQRLSLLTSLLMSLFEYQGTVLRHGDRGWCRVDSLEEMREKVLAAKAACRLVIIACANQVHVYMYTRMHICM